MGPIERGGLAKTNFHCLALSDMVTISLERTEAVGSGHAELAEGNRKESLGAR
jgi:hypothetical protein